MLVLQCQLIVIEVNSIPQVFINHTCAKSSGWNFYENKHALKYKPDAWSISLTEFNAEFNIPASSTLHHFISRISWWILNCSFSGFNMKCRQAKRAAKHQLVTTDVNIFGSYGWLNLYGKFLCLYKYHKTSACWKVHRWLFRQHQENMWTV